MILVTGGLGFIGLHTTRALLDLGESCVLGQRRPDGPPADLADRQVVVDRVDINNEAELLAVGDRHKITGIVHLAGSMPWPRGADMPVAEEPVGDARAALNSLFNVMHAAREWDVPRVTVASTIGVYGGVAGAGPRFEDMPLPMTSGHVIPAFKKIGELLNDYLADTTGLDIVNLRIGAIWGPGGRPTSPFFAVPQLVRAAINGTTPDLSRMTSPAYAEDAIDLCYVKDCGRAIALLQLADRLNHRTYNVSAGRATTNAELIAAIRQVVPDARIDLPSGGDGEQSYLDITRIGQDTGYRPAYDTETAVADYIDWLRAGNER
ncbi:NAD-dependent epimerase/dehydratase family protein [Actinocrispum wychmicini]|uniref:UDP-glucose 4-epimerase n=1 Tax=Actinocrispum wychmicini TaxID=1213861 RepID=A0A4R2JUK7_9PSEU|nr:NAD(P)-dependent oxidoreductase [Actinocrispum wychmicini]TCO60998.1 UDP-glucose 4-epimerase [Actinocrispum wychmicini]